MDQPVILCGLGEVGRRILDYLTAAGLPVVVIDNRCTPEELKLGNVRLIRGDFRQREILDRAGISNARGVLIVTSKDLVNISVTLLIRHIDPNVRIVVRLFNQNLIPRLGKAVSNVFALSVSQLTAPMLALTAVTGQALGTFHAHGEQRLIAEIQITPQSSIRDQPIASVAARHHAQIVAHIPADGDPHFIHEVDHALRLATGDRLVICGDARDLEPLMDDATGESSPHIRWAGWLRRHARVLWRTIVDIDPLVKIWTVVLVTVVLSSTLVYYLTITKPLAYSFMRAVSIVSSGDDLHDADNREEWQMLFVSFLRLAGAAVMAAFTAFLTNYLLQARLGGALELRRIPDSGHVIVCGLGNVGFRLVEELVRNGQRVVVIEMQRDGRFMAAARRMNVAMIIGDATVLEVLRQAHSATARAVVAATNNELVNIEIALLARELNPRERVVVRLNDPQLCETLREAANINLALSLPSLAAPAFVAALFGDRVLTVFLVKRRVLAALEFAVSADDTQFIGETVPTLAIDYGLLPLAVRDAEGLTRPQPLNHRFAVGDRLICLMALPDLGRMLRRDAVPTNWSVEVTAFKLPARPLVLQLLRERLKMQPEEAEAASAKLPQTVASHLTRGRAEDLKATLAGNGIDARVNEDREATKSS